jgi:hypothetical protein
MNKFAAFAALTLAALAIAADKKDWKTGHINDAQIVQGDYKIGGLVIRNQSVLVSGEFVYTVDRVHKGSLEASLCRFIVGDDVKYRQDKSRLHLIDADGKECTGEIVRQERFSSPAPRP